MIKKNIRNTVVSVSEVDVTGKVPVVTPLKDLVLKGTINEARALASAQRAHKGKQVIVLGVEHRTVTYAISEEDFLAHAVVVETQDNDDEDEDEGEEIVSA